MEQNLLPPPSPEARFEPARTLDQLRHVRETDALRTSENVLRFSVGSLDTIDRPDSALVKVPNWSVSYDVGQVSYSDLMAYDCLGVNPEEMFDFLAIDENDNGQNEFEISVDEETITTKRYGRGVSLTYDVEGLDKDKSERLTPEKIKEKVKERLATSPAHVAIKNLNEQLQESDEVIGGVRSEFFNPDTDKLGSLDMLVKAGFLSYIVDEGLVTGDQPVADLLAVHELNYGVEIQEKSGSVTYRKSENGRIIEVVVDKDSGEIAFGFDRDVDYFYNEQANQSSAESVPFVDTVCAREMFSALDELGITLSPDYLAEMTRIGEADRFGSVYTQLSREVSKWVDRPERLRVLNVFVDNRAEPDTQNDEDYDEFAPYGDEMTAEVEEIKKKLLSIDTSGMSEPTQVLFTMIQDSLDRKTVEDTGLPELPITSSEVHIDGGACFDVTSYYVGAAGDRNGLTRIEIDGVRLLEKTHGSHTFMVEEPVLLNGVRLPKGSLMQKGEDGGWAVLRLTPFCFDNDADRLATGSELAKTELNENRSIKSIGGTALTNIILGAAK